MSRLNQASCILQKIRARSSTAVPDRNYIFFIRNQVQSFEEKINYFQDPKWIPSMKTEEQTLRIWALEPPKPKSFQQTFSMQENSVFCLQNRLHYFQEENTNLKQEKFIQSPEQQSPLYFCESKSNEKDQDQGSLQKTGDSNQMSEEQNQDLSQNNSIQQSSSGSDQIKRQASRLNGLSKVAGSFIAKAVPQMQYWEQFGKTYRNIRYFRAAMQRVRKAKSKKKLCDQLFKMQKTVNDQNFYKKLASFLRQIDRSEWKETKNNRYAYCIILLEDLDYEIKTGQKMIRVGKQNRRRFDQLRR